MKTYRCYIEVYDPKFCYRKSVSWTKEYSSYREALTKIFEEMLKIEEFNDDALEKRIQVEECAVYDREI